MADISTEQLPIGKRIMRYRVRAGMSRNQLSGLIGKSPSWLYKVERGVLMPDRLSVLSELASVLRVDISELAGAPVPTALLSPAATARPRVPAVVSAPQELTPPLAAVAASPAPVELTPPPAVVAVPPASEETPPPLAVVAAPPASEASAPRLAVVAASPAVVSAPAPSRELTPQLAVVSVPPAAGETAFVPEAPAAQELAPEPAVPAVPWRQTTAAGRRRAVGAVMAVAAAVAVLLLLSGAVPPSGADSPHAQAVPPMTVFPAPGADTPIPPPTAGPGSPEGSHLVAGPPPGTGPHSATAPGPAAARPSGGTPAVPVQGAGARTSTAAPAPAPSGTSSQSPSVWDLASWWPSASTASSGTCGGSSSSGCDQGSAQSGRCSNVAYDADTGAVPDTGLWHLTVRVGSGGTLCAHWDNAGIEGTLTGPDGRSRLVPGDTWMVLSGGPGRYTLQLRRIDPSRPDHAHLQMFG
jgi:transcriptional regulator with XRE-family HTH domain